MIRAGREAVDTTGIARLHGLTPSQARRARPWADPTHPPRITTGTPATGQPDLWDEAQARAYARGEPIPPLPTDDAPEDLLDRAECAAELDVKPQTWTDYRSQGKIGQPDRVVCGREHWFRRTVEQLKARRDAARENPTGGRPRGSGETMPRAEVARRVREMFEGGETNAAEIARQVGCSYSAARTHVARLKAGTDPQ
ncbi:hypothetical protein AB0A74_07065 [Saccharothrix sp. NPDC042600]|uniref:hypothetical protein n=1 Tax=Saccharothrix TaxID=2071 RepID=UPI0033E44DC1|nr:hypothetical protein GCM10017745_30650 [Saccharothrix mutabilis subsp. capreolus]